jgi:hypothetical protein
VSRLVQLVADYGPGDLRFGEVMARIALMGGDVSVCSVRVPRGETLAAGLCIADLALGPGPRDRIVVHDVRAPERDPRLWIGRTGDGAMVIGADRGWTWSFVASGLCRLCTLDLPAVAEVALAVRHASTRHPHAVGAAVPLERIPAPPACVLVWTGREGDLQTTLASAPGGRVRVRIGRRSALARCGGAPGDGELVLEPGARGLQRLTLGGGSAARRFGDPAAGTPVLVSPVTSGDARG